MHRLFLFKRNSQHFSHASSALTIITLFVPNQIQERRKKKRSCLFTSTLQWIFSSRFFLRSVCVLLKTKATTMKCINSKHAPFHGAQLANFTLFQHLLVASERSFINIYDKCHSTCNANKTVTFTHLKCH